MNEPAKTIVEVYTVKKEHWWQILPLNSLQNRFIGYFAAGVMFGLFWAELFHGRIGQAIFNLITSTLIIVGVWRKKK